MIHPFRRAVLALALPLAVRRIGRLPDLTPDQATEVDSVRTDPDMRAMLLAQGHDALSAHPGAMQAMQAAEAAGSNRPFIDWLFSPAGMAWVMQIVTLILSMFGISLPPIPLPPIPPAPALRAAVPKQKAKPH